MPASLRIAVLEDHDELRDLTVALLQQHGHHVFGVYDAEELTNTLATREIDLLVLDLNLPGENGLSVARRFKALMPRLYIVITTALGDLEDRVHGYDSGADIYLAKPVSERELVAAVASISRRLESVQKNAPNLTLELPGGRLVGTQTIDLSPSELVLLKVLIQAPWQQVETWQLLEATGRGVDARAKASLEVQIVGLRKKIAAVGHEGASIRAIRNGGYQLLCPIQIR